MEKKKAKLNIVDIIIIVVVLAAVVFVGWKMLGGSQPEETVQVLLTVYEEECPDFVIDRTQIGDSCYDDEGMVYMGKVVSIERDDSVSYSVDQYGEIHSGTKAGYSAVRITLLAEGVMTDHGVSINGVMYGIGHTFVFRAGLCKYYLQVYDIQLAD